MKNYRLISMVCGIAASLSLLFLPVLGGGFESATGLRLINMSSNYVPELCKFCLLIAIACGIGIALLRPPFLSLALGILGIVLVLAMNQTFYEGHGEMFSGAYIAMLVFIGAAVCGYLGRYVGTKKNKSVTHHRQP